MIYGLVWAVISILVILILVVLIILTVKPTYSQTLTVKYDFADCWRYLPTTSRPQQLNRMKITVASRRDITVPDLHSYVNEGLLQPYDNALLVYESHIFEVVQTKYRRIPTAKLPTLENLSLLFFNDLSLRLRSQGIRLVSLSLYGEGLKTCHERQAGHTPTEP